MLGSGGIFGSSEERFGLRLPKLPLLAPGDFPELALNLAGSSKSTAIHLLERPVGRVEDETARQSNGDADGAAFQLDCKSLHAHSISPGEQQGTLANGSRGCSVARLWKLRFALDAFRYHREALSAPPAARAA